MQVTVSTAALVRGGGVDADDDEDGMAARVAAVQGGGMPAAEAALRTAQGRRRRSKASSPSPSATSSPFATPTESRGTMPTTRVKRLFVCCDAEGRAWRMATSASPSAAAGGRRVERVALKPVHAVVSIFHGMLRQPRVHAMYEAAVAAASVAPEVTQHDWLLRVQRNVAALAARGAIGADEGAAYVTPEAYGSLWKQMRVGALLSLRHAEEDVFVLGATRATTRFDYLVTYWPVGAPNAHEVRTGMHKACKALPMPRRVGDALWGLAGEEEQRAAGRTAGFDCLLLPTPAADGMLQFRLVQCGSSSEVATTASAAVVGAKRKRASSPATTKRARRV